MKEIVETKYQCEYCGAILKAKLLAEAHEEKCSQNPSTYKEIKKEFFIRTSKDDKYCNINCPMLQTNYLQLGVSCALYGSLNYEAADNGYFGLSSANPDIKRHKDCVEG